MSGFEGDQVYYADQNLAPESHDQSINPADAVKLLKRFISEWQYQNRFPYRDQLRSNTAHSKFYLEVDFDDLNNFDQVIASILKMRPLEYIQVFEDATREVYGSLEAGMKEKTLPEFQVQIISKENSKPLRELKSHLINQMITVSGIVLSASRVQVKAKRLYLQCKSCHHVKIIEVPSGIKGPSVPRYCESTREIAGTQPIAREKCDDNPYVIVSEKCLLIDQQVLKLQENPESVPTGEIPRTIQVCLDRYLVDKLTPGARVTLTGIYTVVESGQISMKTNTSALKIPYLLVVGLQFDKSGPRRFQSMFSMEEEEQFRTMSKDPNIYEKIAKSIGSAIYGNEDIKKAIACLLFGGSRKVLPDRMKLRGDINILLIGDPSTAKSQFLKFVERVAPIAIYTSGKGSSAAGLTASIIKDASSGEFQLEGGAMVLADGGIVCIDEFDKMRSQDRVAIHEAMEQQTISVAKAGITSILNSRTSVLAAANPIYGSYDDSKGISDQIELQTTILSRFDCIFIVRDLKNAEYDKTLANHIIKLHMGTATLEMEETDIDLNMLKKYIHYARSKVSPRLTEEAAINLQNLYVEDRRKVQQGKQTKKNHIPITVRQLEAIIRIAEANAKIRLSNEVTVENVTEAHRLFQVSTLSAIQSGLDVGIDIPSELAGLVLKIEESIKRRVPIGSKINHMKLSEDLVQRFNNLRAVEMAILNMVKNDEFQQMEGRKVLFRKK